MSPETIDDVVEGKKAVSYPQESATTWSIIKANLENGLEDVKRARHPKLQATIAGLGYAISSLKVYSAYDWLTNPLIRWYYSDSSIPQNNAARDIIEAIVTFTIASIATYFLVKKYIKTNK